VTALTALTASARAEEDAGLRAVPWRRMAWVIWRQHRLALTGVAAFLGVVAVYLWITGLRLHHAYAAATACHPAGSTACSVLVDNFNGIARILANGFVLPVLPALIGALVGAPVLARELETGTFSYAWTQGFGGWRWTLAKLAALGVVVVAIAGAISALFSWYYQPYFSSANQSMGLAGASPLVGGLFDLRGLVFAAWTLVAFAIGALAGLLIRRVVPAIVVALVAYAGIAVAAGSFLREHYLAPIVTRALNIPSSAWVLSQQWFTRGDQPVSRSVVAQVLQGTPFAGKGGVPDALSSWQYLVHHGYTQWTTYQPAGRFWTFQWIEGGWVLALSVMLIATTVWLVRRRAL
jgi:ABC-type transport system involved in multi-copper enzyme maturation permease subunit